MEMMGQGLVLMIFGMGFVYLFLWLMIVVIRHSSRFVCKFEHLLPDDAPKPKRKPLQGADLRYLLWSGSIVSGVLLTLVAFVYACTL